MTGILRPKVAPEPPVERLKALGEAASRQAGRFFMGTSSIKMLIETQETKQ